jgi:Zn-dependent protease with chaperone function
LKFILHTWAVCASLYTLQPTGQAQPHGPNLTKLELSLLDQCQALEHQLERRALIYRDSALDEHVSAVSRALLPGVAPPYIHWRFLVLRDPLVNSFSLPDGTICLSTGLLAILENDDQLASVLAHEITHVTKGDAFEVQREYRKKETMHSIRTVAVIASSSAFGLAGLGLSLAVESTLAEAGDLIPLWVTSGYGDQEEREADEAAIALLAQAGRDPSQLSGSLSLMSELLDAEPVSTFYSDRAKLRQRVADLERPSTGQTLVDEPYFEAVQGAIRENIPLDITSRHFRTAVASAARVVAARPDDARAISQLGESYRSLGPRSAKPSAEERSDAGERAAIKGIRSHTVEEENKSFALTTAGRAFLDSNWKQAEHFFQQAASMQPLLPEPHRGLGALFGSQSRIAEARAEYRKYLELAPRAADRRQIENRLSALDGSSAPR